MTTIYFAHPAFNPEQKEISKKVTKRLRDDGFNVINPFELMPDLETELDEESKKLNRDTYSKLIYSLNCQSIEDCDIVMALIDDRDPGVMYELGLATGLCKKIVTFSMNNYGSNIMIEKCSVLHWSNFDKQYNKDILIRIGYLARCESNPCISEEA